MKGYKFKIFCWRLRRYLALNGIDTSKMDNEYIRYKLSFCMIREMFSDMGYDLVGMSDKDIEEKLSVSAKKAALAMVTVNEFTKALLNMVTLERKR